MASDSGESDDSTPAQDGATHRVNQRASTTDRQGAVDALAVHTRAGRITAQEFEERSQTAKAALTWGAIDALFADLPAPHPAPVAEPATVDRVTPVPASSAPRPLGAADGPDAQGGLVPPQLGRWVMALAPPAAMILFFTTWQWWWWLLIPLAGTIVYGPHGGSGWHGHSWHGRDRRRSR